MVPNATGFTLMGIEKLSVVGFFVGAIATPSTVTTELAAFTVSSPHTVNSKKC
ncbi:hypothetical protein [Pragia fontium]|uniref:hypothetical protein n=1 Tax=Pragia fontium TaxID=82985 RepID=UPI00130EE149|nr:hypothetical protein [Pragia fontium]